MQGLHADEIRTCKKEVNQCESGRSPITVSEEWIKEAAGGGHGDDEAELELVQKSHKKSKQKLISTGVKKTLSKRKDPAFLATALAGYGMFAGACWATGYFKAC